MNIAHTWSPLFLRIVASTLWCILALMLLSGCATPPPAPRPSLPPLPMLEPRPVPAWEGRTYRDVIGYALQLREADGACEADKAAARAVLEPAK